MASVLYKQHLIVSSSSFDQATEKWSSAIFISWKTAGMREFHTMQDLVDRFERGQDAEAFGIELAKIWVDEHI